MPTTSNAQTQYPLNSKKAALLNELQEHTFVKLQPSTVAGIGVFAIRPIKAGEHRIFSRDSSEWIQLSKAEVEDLPEPSRKLIENFCLYDEQHYFVPEYGFKIMDLVVYLNHSDTPNVRSINEGEEFEAIRDIEAGEELFVDYGEIVGS